MRSLLTLTLIVVGSAMTQFVLPVANACHVQGQPEPNEVRKIHVGRMGDSDESERFRLLLEEALTAKGFMVVDQPEKADAVLTGALSVRVHDKKTRARVFVKLSTPAGVRLWGKDFGSRITSPFNRTEPVKLRAQDVANALRNELMDSKK